MRIGASELPGSPPACSFATSVVQARDSGYIVIGQSGFHDRFGCCVSWAAKLDLNGNVLWVKGDGGRIPTSIDLTSDGGYVIAGYSVGVQGEPDQAFLTKIDTNDNGWSRSYGMSERSNSRISSVHETSDGGFIAGGSLENALWAFKTDKNGLIQWQRAVNGTGTDSITSIQEIRNHSQSQIR